MTTTKDVFDNQIEMEIDNQFLSPYYRPQRFSSPTGTPTDERYEMKVTDTGDKELVKTGKIERYKMIQEPLESCLIENIINRYNAGDETALNKRHPQYGDFSEIPDILDIRRIVGDSENTFNSLPIEVRNAFGHSVGRFISSIQNGTFDTVIQSIKPEPKPEPTPKQEDKKE